MSFRFNTALFPIDIVSFVKDLPDLGFVLAEQLIDLPVGPRIELKGPLARKGALSLLVNSDAMTLGIAAPDLEQLLQTATSIEALLDQTFRLDLPSIMQYYEFVATMTVKANQNPLVTNERFAQRLPFLQHASNIFETPVMPYGLRLAMPGSQPIGSIWFDFRIEPLVQLASTHYLVEAVYRDPDRHKVTTFAENFPDYTQRLLQALERAEGGEG
jgi:hypothetical protein